jgi:hypothetical protein
MDEGPRAAPTGHESGFRESMHAGSRFTVADVPGSSSWVAFEPGEGSGVVSRYFTAYRIADAATDLAQPKVWRHVQENPPWADKPAARFSPEQQKRFDALASSDDILDVMQRLGVAAALADAAGTPGVCQREMPHLFARYPQGALWYIAVDQRLVARIAFMRCGCK